MSVLDELERSLARAVDAGAAADPGRATATAASTPTHDASNAPAAEAPAGEATSHTTRSRSGDPAGARARRRRPRRPWHVLLALVLAGGVTTGALAATGNLPVLKEERAPYLPMVADQGAGVPDTPVEVLPLRVADPFGGPPWVIRTFRTNRGAGCAQAGQLYRGQFGVVEQDDRGRRVFRLIGIHIGETARCTNAVHDGFPVLRGLRTVASWRAATGPGGAPCGAAAPGGRGGPRMGAATKPCPIARTRVMRFGLLGKEAREARFVRADGTRSAPQQLAATSGGAYLFVEEIDAEPFRQMDELQWKANEAFQAGPPMPQQKDPRTMTKAERTALGAAMRERMRAADAFTTGPEARAIYRSARARDGVDASFTDGTTFRVAGSGVSRRRLPGVRPVRDDLPETLPAPVTATWRGRDRAIGVSFPAPVALDRFARYYRVSVRGPLAPTCRLMDSQADYVHRAPVAGQVVRVQLRRLQRPGAGFMPWCKGARYTVRVVHHTGTNPGGVDRPVGSTTFVGR